MLAFASLSPSVPERGERGKCVAISTHAPDVADWSLRIYRMAGRRGRGLNRQQDAESRQSYESSGTVKGGIGVAYPGSGKHYLYYKPIRAAFFEAFLERRRAK